MPQQATEEPKAKTPPTPPAEDPNKKKAEPGAAASTFFERMTKGAKTQAKPADPKPPTDKKLDDDKAKKEAEEKSKQEEEAKKKAEETKKKAAPVAPVNPPAIDPETIAAAASRGAAEALAKSKEKEEPKAPEVTEGLADDERETYEVLLRMEKDLGGEYKGKAAAYAESLKKADKYQEDWEKANPGREFNADDPEHQEFLAKNQVEWNSNQFMRTMARMEADRLLEKEREKNREKETERERKDRLRDEEPKITAQKRAVAKNFFKSLGVEYDKVIGENGAVDVGEVKRIIEADPVKAIAFEAAEQVEAFTGLMYRLTNGLEKFSEKDEGHKYIGNFWTEQEILLKNLPPEQQRDERGRMFATAEEWRAMTPAKQAYYWTLAPDDVSAMFAASQSKQTQARISEEEKRIEKAASARGFVKKEATPSAPQTPPEKKEEAAPQPTPKPVSPSGEVAPTLAQPGTAAGQSKTSTFFSRMTGKA